MAAKPTYEELEAKLARYAKAEADQARTTRALQASEERFKSLIEHTSDAVFCYEYDPPIPIRLPLGEQIKKLDEGVLAECNDICAASYGEKRREDVIRRKLVDLFGTTPGSLDRLFADMIRGGYSITDGEGVEILEDGTERYFLNNAHGIIENDRLTRVWGAFRDITEQCRTLFDRFGAVHGASSTLGGAEACCSVASRRPWRAKCPSR